MGTMATYNERTQKREDTVRKLWNANTADEIRTILSEYENFVVQEVEGYCR